MHRWLSITKGHGGVPQDREYPGRVHSMSESWTGMIFGRVFRK